MPTESEPEPLPPGASYSGVDAAHLHTVSPVHANEMSAIQTVVLKNMQAEATRFGRMASIVRNIGTHAEAADSPIDLHIQRLAPHLVQMDSLECSMQQKMDAWSLGSAELDRAVEWLQTETEVSLRAISSISSFDPSKRVAAIGR